MENVSTEALARNKEHYLGCKDKAEKYDDVLWHMQQMSKYNKLTLKRLGHLFQNVILISNVVQH